ncbi:MAG: S1C family serine protease [Planctomycetes bacterium]|nr:S1C family serine protease [Planctomycetota bacterium]
MTSLRRRSAAAVCLAVLGLVLAVPAAAPARADLQHLEAEFKEAIERVETATVVLAPSTSPRGSVETSGVIISKAGLVLTHCDVGLIEERSRDGSVSKRFADVVDVKVQDTKKGTFTNYHGRVIARLPDFASALVRIDDAPKSGLAAYLVPAASADLRVGSFAFAMGNSFGFSTESTPSLTAGIIASLPRRTGSTDQGLFDMIYTTAAINPGVNGGPLVDVHGRLVGVIVGFVDARAEPTSPYQFIGRVMPIDRLRTAWAGDAEAKSAFSAAPPRALVSPDADALELVVSRAVATAHPAALSLEVQRKSPLSSVAIADNGKPVELPRYRGPVSAFAATPDGIVVTALYNVTNTATLIFPGLAQMLPKDATTKAGLDAIEGATLHLPDGTSCPAKLLAVHEGLGIAAFRAELPAGRTLPTLAPAPADAYAEGRFAIGLGNPFGAARSPEPFTTFGILSKLHADDAAEIWRGHWQVDARATDGNCGGPAVDLRGRLLGMLTLWDPAHQGRASGIGFVLPWQKIAGVLPDLAAGKTFRRPFLGVSWDQTVTAGARIQAVVDGSAAKAAGLQGGDEIVEIDGKPIASIGDCSAILSRKWAGDPIKLKIRRGPDIVALDATLGTRD